MQRRPQKKTVVYIEIANIDSNGEMFPDRIIPEIERYSAELHTLCQHFVEQIDAIVYGAGNNQGIVAQHTDVLPGSAFEREVHEVRPWLPDQRLAVPFATIVLD